MPYGLDKQTGYIDYEKLDELASRFIPRLIIAGASAYSREYDYARMRSVSDKVEAYLLSDIAHISGLLAAGVLQNNPFDCSDIITTTTHKTLRGPRAGLIFYRKGVRSVDAKGNSTLYDLEEKINSAVFPGFQGGPHNNAIAAISVCLKEALAPEFRAYQSQVVSNSKHMAAEMVRRGYQVVSGGTDNHLFLLDLRSRSVDGSRADKVLELCSITVNKNTVPGDTKPMVPGGIRIGTPAMTTRGLTERDFTQVAEFVDRGISIASEINKQGKNATSLKEFGEAIKRPNAAIEKLRNEVEQFSKQFPMP